MAGPWITIDTLTQLVASSLKKEVGDLAGYWTTTFIPGALVDSTADIQEILQGKGFTQAQIDAWDNRVTYQQDIALYLALVKGGAMADYDQTTIDKLDRRKMLTDANAIMINGVIVQPGDVTTGAGAYGGHIPAGVTGVGFGPGSVANAPFGDPFAEADNGDGSYHGPPYPRQRRFPR